MKDQVRRPGEFTTITTHSYCVKYHKVYAQGWHILTQALRKALTFLDEQLEVRKNV